MVCTNVPVPAVLPFLPPAWPGAHAGLHCPAPGQPDAAHLHQTLTHNKTPSHWRALNDHAPSNNAKCLPGSKSSVLNTTM